MSRAGLLALMISLPHVAPAMAHPLERELPPRREVCWERLYDAAHLAAKPRQKVTQIRLMHMPPAAPYEDGKVYLQLHFNLRDRKTSGTYDYAYGGFCKARGQALRCQSEWEGGVFHVARGPGGTLDIRNSGLIINPSNYDSEDISDDAVRVPAKPDDGVWRLSPATRACTFE